LNFREGAAIELDVFAKASASGIDHGAQGIDHELGAREVGWRLSQVHGGDLDKYEDVIAQDSLDRGLTKVLDLLGVLEVVSFVHCTKLPGA